MKQVGNINELDEAYIWRDKAGLVSKELGKSVGSKKIYANMDIVPPRCLSTKYHSHSQQEEFFFIVSGEGTLRLQNKEIAIKKGDFLAKPAGEGIAHTFFNSGKENLVILDVGTNEPEDTCYYPDEDVYMHKSNGTRHIVRSESFADDWSPNPND
ncbi:MAG: cupin domain-containing protein [Sphaerochaetaceae bacterium]